MKIFRAILISYLYISLWMVQCTIPKTQSPTNKTASHPIECHLISAVQIKSAPNYYKIPNRLAIHNIPALSIGIIEKHKLVFAKGYGYGRVKDQIPATSKSVYQAGSISKSVTGIVAIKLRDQGKLDLDKDITAYLRSWQMISHPLLVDNKITLRHLLNHTAGLNNINGIGYYQNENAPTVIEILNQDSLVQVSSIPGEKFKYSNLGYLIVQQVIEDITNESFASVANNLVFDPLGMTHSTFESISPSKAGTEYCYSYDDEGKPIRGYWKNIVRKCSGGLFTSIEDLAKLNIAIAQSLSGESNFLKQASAQQIFSATSYNLGFEVKVSDDNISFSHSGRTVGYFAYMHYNITTGTGLILLANSDNGGGIFKEILRGYSDLNHMESMKPKVIDQLDLPLSTLNQYVGDYSLKLGTDTYEMKISVNGNDIVYQMKGDRRVYTLKPLSDTKFIDIDDNEIIEFIKEGSTVKELVTNGEYTFLKIE